MLHTASERVRRTRRRDRRDGRPTGAGAPTVGRWAHAYHDGHEATLCALPLELLYWEEFRHVDFADVPHRDRCRFCADLAGLA